MSALLIAPELRHGDATAMTADTEQRPWRLATTLVHHFVNAAVVLTVPDRIYWCNGSGYERERLLGDARREAASAASHRGAQRAPGAVTRPARPADRFASGHPTCTPTEDGQGAPAPRMDGTLAYAAMHSLFEGCMRGRTLYVVPFVFDLNRGPIGVAVQVTDSIEVALATKGRSHVGDDALRQLGASGDFLRCLHSSGDPGRPDERCVCHFPADRAVWSFGRGAATGDGRVCPECMALGLANA